MIFFTKHYMAYGIYIFLDIGIGSDRVHRPETRKFVGLINSNDFLVEMHKISIQRGVSWEEAISLAAIHTDTADGFYISVQGYKRKPTVVLVYAIGNFIEGLNRLYSITRPNTGRSPKHESLNDITMKYKKCTQEEAEPIWKDYYEGRILIKIN